MRSYRRRQRDRTQAVTALSSGHALPVPSLRSARYNLETLYAPKFTLHSRGVAFAKTASSPADGCPPSPASNEPIQDRPFRRPRRNRFGGQDPFHPWFRVIRERVIATAKQKG